MFAVLCSVFAQPQLQQGQDCNIKATFWYYLRASCAGTDKHILRNSVVGKCKKTPKQALLYLKYLHVTYSVPGPV